MTRTSTSSTFPGSAGDDLAARTIRLDGRRRGEQRPRLLAPAERCPVDRALTGEIRVAAQLV